MRDETNRLRARLEKLLRDGRAANRLPAPGVWWALLRGEISPADLTPTEAAEIETMLTAAGVGGLEGLTRPPMSSPADEIDLQVRGEPGGPVPDE